MTATVVMATTRVGASTHRNHNKLYIRPYCCKYCRRYLHDFRQYVIHRRRHEQHIRHYWYRQKMQKKQPVDVSAFQTLTKDPDQKNAFTTTYIEKQHIHEDDTQCRMRPSPGTDDVRKTTYYIPVHVPNTHLTSSQWLSNDTTTNGPYRCQHCKDDESYGTLSDFITYHLHKVHMPFICNNCNIVFSQQSNLHNHKAHCISNVDNNVTGIYQRPYIHVQTNGKVSYGIMCINTCMTVGKNAQALITPMSPMSQPTGCNLTERSDDVNGAPSMTGRTHFNKKAQSLDNEEMEKPHKCTMCGKSFLRRRSLVRHIKQVHNLHSNEKAQSLDNKKMEKPHKCTICGKSFLRRQSLVHHMKQVHNLHHQFKCRFCNKKFLLQSHLQVHEKNHTLKYYLQLHEKINTTVPAPEKRVTTPRPDASKVRQKCDAGPGDAQFPTTNELIAPTSIHSSKPHMDEDDDKQSIRSSILADDNQIKVGPTLDADCIKKITSIPVHVSSTDTISNQWLINSTTTKGPYRCQDCNDSESYDTLNDFISKHLQKVHMPLQCKYCNMGFSQGDHLYDHYIKAYCISRVKESLTYQRPYLHVHSNGKVSYEPLCINLKTGTAVSQNDKPLLPITPSLVVNPFKICNICNRCFSSTYFLKEHQEFHSTGRYVCLICTARFSTKERRQLHILTYHANIPPKSQGTGCSLTERPDEVNGNATVQQAGLIERPNTKAESLDSQETDEVTGTATVQQAGLIERPDTNKAQSPDCQETKKPYKCTKCGKSFLAKQYLFKHKKKVHGYGYKCRLCDMKFMRKSTFKIHESNHITELAPRDEANKFCQNCGARFVTTKELKAHASIHVNKPYICKYCTLVLKTKPALWCHVHRHAKERPHKCKVCFDGFDTKQSLLTHQVIHIYKYKCKFCPRRFRMLNDMQAHQSIHTTVPASSFVVCPQPDTHTSPVKQKTLGLYVCQYCGKSMKSHQLLEEHEETHTKDRNYRCRFCSKCFKYSSNRTVHEKIHLNLGK